MYRLIGQDRVLRHCLSEDCVASIQQVSPSTLAGAADHQ